MIAKTLKTSVVAVLALTMGAFALAVPANAAGQVALSYTPTDADESKALGMGLQMFSLVNGMSASGGNIGQNGFGNAAGIAQNGAGNHGLLLQDGNGHTGTIEQNGNNNNCGLFQFGENTNGQCVQTGNGQSSLTTVFGF